MRKSLIITCLALCFSLIAFSQANCDDQYVLDMAWNSYQYQQNQAFCNTAYGGYSTTSGVNCMTVALQIWSSNDAQNYTAYMNCKYPIALNFKKKTKRTQLV